MTETSEATAVEPFLPFAQPGIGQEEIDEVVDTLRSGWLTGGPKVQAFEEGIRKVAGADHAVALSSCTAGMHLALLALGIGPGDEVITTPLTFAATVNVILHAGATPVLADVCEDDYNIDLARDLGLPLVVVAANELGTINATLQTLITAGAAAPRLPIAGIVLNQTRGEADESAATNAAELAVRCDVMGTG